MSPWSIFGICYLGLCITIVILAYINAEYEDQHKRKESRPAPKQILRQTDLEWIDEVTSNL